MLSIRVNYTSGLVREFTASGRTSLLVFLSLAKLYESISKMEIVC